jgi:hypothetical protein
MRRGAEHTLLETRKLLFGRLLGITVHRPIAQAVLHLRDMSQLVADETNALGRPGLPFAMRERDLVSIGKRPGTKRRCLFACIVVMANTYPREVAEERFGVNPEGVGKAAIGGPSVMRAGERARQVVADLVGAYL